MTYTSVKKSDNRLKFLIMHMECRFVVGAFSGVCIGWAVTDTMLGVHVQIAYSVVTIFVCFIYFHIMTVGIMNEEKEEEDDEETDSNSYIMVV